MDAIIVAVGSVPDPFFSWFAILVVVFLVGGICVAIDRYEEDRQRREQEQHEESMTQARMELTVRLTALRGIK